jgi:hypothetical protein
MKDNKRLGHRLSSMTALLALTITNLGGVAAAAQVNDRMARPAPAPADQPAPQPTTRPAPPPLTRPAPRPTYPPQNRPQNRPETRPQNRPQNRPENRPQPERPQVLPGGPAVGGGLGNQSNWGNGQWDRTVQCRSVNNRYQECRVDARGGAQLQRVLRGDCRRGNWGYRSTAVWVDRGCQAEFVVRSSNWNGGGGSGGGNWNGGNLNATVRCESQNYRYRECRADTSGGVRLQRVIGGRCQSRDWGYRRDMIWVDNGCRADFAVRGGSYNNSGGGPSAGAIIGGVAVAAGLAALLASSSKSKDSAPGTPATANAPPANAGMASGNTGPARINVDRSIVAEAARPSFETCLNEAALQIGATGGTAIAVTQMRNVEPGNGGYRFSFDLTGTWPDETRNISSFCRATPSRVVELDFR